MPAKKKPVTKRKKPVTADWAPRGTEWRKKPVRSRNTTMRWFGAAETRSGLVNAWIEAGVAQMTRDQALLFAIEMIVASSGLSRKEVAQHFSK